MRRSTALRRHDFDPVAFVFGLAFTGLGVLFMVGRLDLFNHVRWLWPGLLLLLGIAVLAGARGRGGSQTRQPARTASGLGAPHPPDLDSIDPPVGPEAFRLPGWPPAYTRTPPPADARTQPLEVDPNAATEVLPQPRSAEPSEPPRSAEPSEPPGSAEPPESR